MRDRGRGGQGELRVCRNCHIKMDDLFVLLIYCDTAGGRPRLVGGNCWEPEMGMEKETGDRRQEMELELKTELTVGCCVGSRSGY